MTGASSPVVQNAAVGKRPAEVCLNDLRVFGEQMQEEGYWLGGSAHAYDDPMGAHGDGDPMSSRPADRTVGYLNARPGYKTRILLASANILARSGQQRLCEDVLATVRETYKGYAANLHVRGIRPADGPGREQRPVRSTKQKGGSVLERPHVGQSRRLR